MEPKKVTRRRMIVLIAGSLAACLIAIGGIVYYHLIGQYALLRSTEVTVDDVTYPIQYYRVNPKTDTYLAFYTEKIGEPDQWINLYTATVDELKLANPADMYYRLYGITFDENPQDEKYGELQTEQQAVQVVAQIIIEKMKCDCVERPLEVAYNDVVEAWVVTGTLPPEMLGGVAEIVITKETGEILEYRHSR